MACYIICYGICDQLWIQPHIRACPRATLQGRAKFRRQHHRSVSPNTGRNPGGRQKKIYQGVHIYVSTLPGGDEMMLHTFCIVLLWRMAISRYQYVDVSIDGRIPRRSVDISLDGRFLRPSTSIFEECHIPRVLSLVTSENLILRRFSDKNITYLVLAWIGCYWDVQWNNVHEGKCARL